MNDNAKKWVEALRSGKYQQTTGALHRVRESEGLPKGYCCLGVACDLFAEELGLVRNAVDRDIEFFTDDTAFLPPIVQDHLGLASYKGRTINESLTTLNDNGVSFEDIANFIESEPEGLFV